MKHTFTIEHTFKTEKSIDKFTSELHKLWQKYKVELPRHKTNCKSCGGTGGHSGTNVHGKTMYGECVDCEGGWKL